MVFHVLAALDSIVRKTDAVRSFRFAADGGPCFVLIVKEGTESHTQYASYLDKRCQRGQVDIVFDTFNLFDGQAGAFGQFFTADVLAFAERLDFLAYNLACIHKINAVYRFTWYCFDTLRSQM